MEGRAEQRPESGKAKRSFAPILNRHGRRGFEVIKKK